MRWIAAVALTVLAHTSAGTSLALEQLPVESGTGSVMPGQATTSVDSRLRIADASFRLTVPFRTQKDGSRWQGSNCGPAILGMILDGFGQPGQSTDDLRFRAHTYQGTVGMRTGTALDHIARVAEDFGVRTYNLYESDGRWRSWSVSDIRDQLQLGRPVMPLVRLYLLPGYESSLPRWGHYVLITGMTDEGFFYTDPLQTDGVEGTGGYMSADRLNSAMRASHIPGQAVAFEGGLTLGWQPI